MHNYIFYLPILFHHISNNDVDKFTACPVLNLSSHGIFLKYLLPSRLLFQNSLDKLDNRNKKKVDQHSKTCYSKTYNIYNIKTNVLQKTTPLWPVKNCHQYADFVWTSKWLHRCTFFFETLERNYRWAIFLKTSEKYHSLMWVTIVTRCHYMRMGQESLKRGHTIFLKTFFTCDFINRSTCSI